MADSVQAEEVLTERQLYALIESANQQLAKRAADSARAMEDATAAMTSGANITIDKSGIDSDLLPVFNTGVLGLQTLAVQLQQIRVLRAVLEKLDTLKPAEVAPAQVVAS
jgi:hypothetical protein